MAGKKRSFMSFRPNKLMTVVPLSVDNHVSELVQPNYSKLSEGLRKNTPTSVMCLAFCGGRKCRFDTIDCWSTEDMAIDGLYSHWITDQVLATSRPNSQIIQQKDIVGQFVRSGIRTIINLQTPGEHSHCGQPLTSSGFSYLPEIFMEKDIYYYNFGWKDYEHGSLQGLLDAVKVLSFAVTQGKVAIHCHAGLGRTGVLLCCYLIYSQRVGAVEAIHYVRRKRPNAVQTSGQITMVQTFEHFLITRSGIFSVSNKDPFTLYQHLENQKEILHGYEARTLRYIPKIVYVICERLLILCRADPSPSLNYWMDEKEPPFTRSFLCFVDVKNPQRQPFRERDQWGSSEGLNMTDEQAGLVPCHRSSQMSYCPALSCDETQVSTEQVVRGLVANPPSDLSALPAVREYCQELDGRQSGWMSLSSEREPQVLAALLWHWFLHLKQPVLSNQELGFVVVYADKPVVCFSRFDQSIRYTVEYLLRFIQRLTLERDAQSDLLRQLASVLTQQAVEIHQCPAENGRKRLGQVTLTQLLHFFSSTIQLINPVRS